MDERHFSTFPNEFLVAALLPASSPSPWVLAPDMVMAKLLSGTHGAVWL